MKHLGQTIFFAFHTFLTYSFCWRSEGFYTSKLGVGPLGASSELNHTQVYKSDQGNSLKINVSFLGSDYIFKKSELLQKNVHNGPRLNCGFIQIIHDQVDIVKGFLFYPYYFFKAVCFFFINFEDHQVISSFSTSNSYIINFSWFLKLRCYLSATSSFIWTLHRNYKTHFINLSMNNQVIRAKLQLSLNKIRDPFESVLEKVFGLRSQDSFFVSMQETYWIFVNRDYLDTYSWVIKSISWLFRSFTCLFFLFPQAPPEGSHQKHCWDRERLLSKNCNRFFVFFFTSAFGT